MKAVVQEYAGCFEIVLDAESIQEAAHLVRMGINATSDLRSLTTTVLSDAHADATGFQTSLVVGKRQRAVDTVPRAK